VTLNGQKVVFVIDLSSITTMTSVKPQQHSKMLYIKKICMHTRPDVPSNDTQIKRLI